MTKSLDDVLSQWAGLGVGFNKQPTDGAIDLERLLLDTARRMPEMARLYTMAATWLHTHSDRVAKDRLSRLIAEELEPEHQASLGLLLDTAQLGDQTKAFQGIIEQLQPADVPKPLFLSARQNPKLADLVNRRASPLSRKWNLWAQPIEFKDDAIRPDGGQINR